MSFYPVLYGIIDTIDTIVGVLLPSHSINSGCNRACATVAVHWTSMNLPLLAASLISDSDIDFKSCRSVSAAPTSSINASCFFLFGSLEHFVAKNPFTHPYSSRVIQRTNVSPGYQFSHAHNFLSTLHRINQHQLTIPRLTSVLYRPKKWTFSH